MVANPWVYVGALLNSALYLTFCFAAGLIEHNHPAEWLAILSAGVCYLSYCAQLAPTFPRAVAAAFVVLSILTGAAAGLVLL